MRLGSYPLSILVGLTLVMRWSWGDMSPQELQHMMHLFKTDLAAGASLDMSLVNILAGIGSEGRNPQHCHRHLLTRLPGTPMPELGLFTISLSHSVYGGFEKLIGIVWPHELFAALYHHYRDAFFMFLVGSASAVMSFWECVRGGARVRLHRLMCISSAPYVTIGFIKRLLLIRSSFELSLFV